MRFTAALFVLSLAACGEKREPTRAETRPMQAATRSGGDLPDCGRFFWIEPGEKLSATEMWQLAFRPETLPVRIRVPEIGDAVLAYRAFDYENRPTDAHRSGVGVVYARASRPGGPVVGGVVWGKEDLPLPSGGGYVLARLADGASVSITPLDADGEDPDRRGRCKGAFVIKLDVDGLLSANGKTIGALK